MARTRNQEAHAKKRKEILHAAESLFLEQGFHQTGMAAICKAAGMSPGTLYRYFSSKTEIIIAFVEEEVAETSLWLDRLAEADDFRAALIDAIVTAMQEVAEPDYGQLALDISAEAGRNEAVSQAIEAADSKAFHQLTSLLKAQTIELKLDPKTAARMLGLLIDGAVGAGASLPSKKKLKAAVTAMVGGIL